MSVPVSTPKARRARSGRGCAQRPSIREVCLIGIKVSCPSASKGWTTGERVTWSGRVYRVEATQTQLRSRSSPRAGYVHLTPVAVDEG